jgi:thioesterase domain-containing protein
MEATLMAAPPSMAIHHQFFDIWEALLGRRPRSIQDDFFALGGHSLLLAAMQTEVEQATGRKFAITAFVQEPTVARLTELLLEHEVEEDGLVMLQRGTERQLPLFYFHGDILGGGFYVRKLAEKLGSSQPVYTFAPMPLRDGQAPALNEIADRRLKQIRACRPHGPYLLGGFCIGALTAFEVARRLEEEGEEVRGVFLINPPTAVPAVRAFRRCVQWTRRSSVEEQVQVFLRGQHKIEQMRWLLRSPWHRKREILMNRLRRKTGRRDDGLSDATPLSAASLTDVQTFGPRHWSLLAFEWIAAGHVPKRLSAPAVLFLTEDQDFASAQAIERRWRKAVARLEVLPLPGDHLTCITRFVSSLATRLRAEIQRLQAFASVACGYSFLAG